MKDENPASRATRGYQIPPSIILLLMVVAIVSGIVTVVIATYEPNSKQPVKSVEPTPRTPSTSAGREASAASPKEREYEVGDTTLNCQGALASFSNGTRFMSNRSIAQPQFLNEICLGVVSPSGKVHQKQLQRWIAYQKCINNYQNTAEECLETLNELLDHIPKK